MAASETKIYPVRGRWTHDAPHAVHTTETKAEADELVKTGAFTLNAKDAERDHGAPDLTAAAPEPTKLPDADMPAGVRHADTAPEAIATTETTPETTEAA